MRRPSVFATAAIAVAVLRIWPAAVPVEAQIPPQGGIARDVVFREGDGAGGEYTVKSMLVGFPGLVLTVANASVVPAGGGGMGGLGIIVGAGQIVYGADGLGDNRAPGFIAGLNVAAGVAGVLAGIRQIRAVGGRANEQGAAAATATGKVLGVRLLPSREGAGILLSWRW